MKHLNKTEQKLINGWQKGFPLTTHPYAQIAAEMSITEEEVLDRLGQLQKRGVLGRIGAVVKPNTVGASSLVAMSVPTKNLEEVAQIVCSEPCVNHNYERENSLNLWFVVTASNAKQLDNVLTRIANKTGYETVRLPLKKAYHIDLGFKL